MNHTDKVIEPENTFRLSLLIYSGVALMLMKVSSALNYAPDTCLLFVTSFFQDFFMMILLFLVFSGFSKVKKGSKRGVDLLYGLLLLLFLISCRIYSRHAPDLMDFPVNIFGVQTGTASFFIEYFLEPLFIIEMFVTTGILITASVFFPVNLKVKTQKMGFLTFALVFFVSLSGPHANPILYSVLDEATGRLTNRKDLGRLDKVCLSKRTNDTLFKDLIKSSYGDSGFKPLYKRVLVLVMESINYKDFVEGYSYRKQDFVWSEHANILRYDKYYCTNLDSYTGLLVMLNALMIPYQAYVDPEKFDFVNQRSNLVRYFNAQGFKTIFLTSYGDQQRRFVPNLRDWNKVICLQEFPKNYTAVTSVKIERACEDLAVLPELMKALREKEHVFLFQEMVYGHTREWVAKKGMNPVAYYNYYFNCLYDSLGKGNLLDSTLIVITSDHGPRQGQTDPESYHVPLLFWAKNLKQENRSDFLAHIDFSDILFLNLFKYKLNIARSRIFTIGNSGNLHYGEIKDNGSFTFIYDRMNKVYSNMHGEQASRFQTNFALYRNTFDALKEPR